MTLRGLDQEAARLSDDDPDLLDPGPEYDRGRDVTDTGAQYSHAGSYAPEAHRSPLAEDSDLMATLRSTSRARNLYQCVAEKQCRRAATATPLDATPPAPDATPDPDSPTDTRGTSR